MKRIVSLFLSVLMVVGIFAIVPVTASAEEDTPLVDVPNGYNLFEFSSLYSADKLNILKNDSKATVTNDEKNGGLILSGKPAEIEKLSIELKDDVDLGSYTAGRLVINAVNEVRFSFNTVVNFDNKDSKSVLSAQQKKSGVWKGEKNNCADISDLKLSGKHTLKFSIKFNDGVDDKKTNLMLKNMLFVAYSVPVVDVNIDESLGSISAMNGDPDHQTECYGNMTINIPDNYEAEYTDEKLTTQTYELESIRGRGNSTWNTTKKPYKVKLKKKASLLGMGENKHWGLIANYYDYSLIRNKYTYWLGAKLNMEFTPKCVFVDVVMNGSYLGSYCLSELIRVDKNRVDIDELGENVTEGDDITGGYLINCGEDSELSNFEIEYDGGNKIKYSVESPDFDEIMVPEQLEYIKNYFQNLYDAIYSDNLCDENGKPYSDYLDVDSMIDYFIIQGTSDNGDAFINGSTYLYKKRGGKLYWGPLWDFDYVAWAAADYLSRDPYDLLRYKEYPMFEQLYTHDSVFKEKFDKRIKEIGDVISESAQDGGQIDIYAKDVYLSQFANHQLIASLYSEQRNNTYLYDEDEVPNITYDSEIVRFKNWLKSRTAYQSENVNKICSGDRIAQFYVDEDVYYEYDFVDWDIEEINVPTPQKEGKVFLYWYTYTTEGETKLEDFYPDNNMDEIAFYAEWKDDENNEDFPALNKSSLSLKAGAAYKLKVKNGKVQGWFTSNPNVATVKNGKVVALKKGSAKIYAVIDNMFHLVCKVKVTANPTIKIGGKAFNPKKTYTLKKSKKLTLTVTGKAASVNNSYSTTNKKVAKVISKTNAKKITIKALKKGKATVTVKINNVAFKIKVKIK